MKRFISILLTIAMVCTMIPLLAVSSFAETVDSAMSENASQALQEKLGQDRIDQIKSLYDSEGDYDYNEIYSILGNEDYDVTNRVEITSDSTSTYELQDNTTYYFKNNVTFTAGPTRSAMMIAPGAKVFLEIPEGVTVTAKGGDATGTAGAGAGIEVPADATLVIKGAGTLIAIGGNGGPGTNGTNGTDGYFSIANGGFLYAGDGGEGGNGGGGAAAGIGGIGGVGGYGGKGGTYPGNGKTVNKHVAVSCDWDNCDCNGSNGENGQSGTNGRDCGKILILGTVTVDATAGQAGTNGAAGKAGKRADDKGSGFDYNYSAGASGGGGGGQGGLQPFYGIGGGGQGGSGGGGGGAGSTRVQKEGRGYPDAATGATGGAGTQKGTTAGSQKGGNGGSSYNSGYSGCSGTVYINKDAKVTGRPCYYYDAVLQQASNLVVTIGEAPLIFGDITKINNYQKKEYEPLALALFEALSHNALDGYEVNVPQTGVAKQSNGCFRYKDGDSWYKEFVDTCGGYIYLVLDELQECCHEDFKEAYDDDDDEANPYQFIEMIFGDVKAAKGKNADIFGINSNGKEMLKLLHNLFFYEHYCEPDDGNRDAPGYTKNHRTTGTHSTKDGALRIIQWTYMNMKESNTNRTLTLRYDTARDHTSGNFHFYYHFDSVLIAEHDKKDGINGSNWMKYLPQTMPITEVNMPGSHDAGMYYTDHLSAFMFLTQTLSITDQLKSGARLFDIRVDAVGEELRVYHSDALGRDTRDDSPLTFDKVNDMCEEFLKENPDQFIILMYNAEAHAMDTPEEARLFENFKKKHNIVDYCDANGQCAEQAAGGKVDTSKTRHYLINLKGDNIVVPSVGFSKNTIYYVYSHKVDKWEDHYDTFPAAKIGWLETAFSLSPKQITGGQTIYWSDKDGNDDAMNSIEALRNHETPADQLVLDSPKIVFASSFWANSFPSIPFFVPNPRDSGDQVNDWLNEYDFREGKHYGYVLLNCTNPYTCSRIYLSNIFQRDKLYGGDYDGDGKLDEKVSVVGSLFSNGILWIVVAVVVAGTIGAVVFVNVNKKKKDTKDE